jgi:hypothetical protein
LAERKILHGQTEAYSKELPVHIRDTFQRKACRKKKKSKTKFKADRANKPEKIAKI